MGRASGLEEGQLRALDRLTRIPELMSFYLAGGTAISHHLGHRLSKDLDLFSRDGSPTLDAVQRAISRSLPDAVVISRTDACLRVLVEGTPVDIVDYPYATLEPPVPGPGGILVAGVRDLAAMKVAAISRRGIYRDFWDLYAICQSGLDLAAAVECFCRRFGSADSDVYHVLRALTYFRDAEREPVRPVGLTAELWERIKAWFLDEAPRLLGGACSP